MKILLALLLSQAVALPKPRFLHVTETLHQTTMIPAWPAPVQAPDVRLFDGPCRAALIVWVPNGYRITVLRANGQHMTQTFSDQSTTLDAEMK